MAPKRRTVALNLKSTLNGETNEYLYLADHRMKDGLHCLHYTDMQGNDATSNELMFREDSMFLRREGGFSGVMEFDPSTETEVKYKALMTEGVFRIETTEYSLEESGDSVKVLVHYVLKDDSGLEPIDCVQEFTFKTPE